MFRLPGCNLYTTQEVCAMTKQRMISEVEERIRRLQEDTIVSKLTAGNSIQETQDTLI